MKDQITPTLQMSKVLLSEKLKPTLSKRLPLMAQTPWTRTWL